MILNQCCSETLLKIVFQQYLPQTVIRWVGWREAYILPPRPSSPAGPDEAGIFSNHDSRSLRPKRSSNQIELLHSVCGAIAVVDASDVSNFAQTPDGQRRNPNINRFAIAKRSVFISTC